MLGLIVNPVAGLGGRVGLKGSDGAEIQARARGLGGQSPAPARAEMALKQLLPLKANLEVMTYPGEMGQDVAHRVGFEAIVVGGSPSGETTAEDTVAAARVMSRRGARLILFAGGDGTARDVLRAVGVSSPVLGIPAGVKILSGSFAATAPGAGDLARRFIQGNVTRLREVEVLDLDEDDYREGRVSPCLYGYLQVPFDQRVLQARKAASGPDERGILQAVAADVVENMQDDIAYIIGPGTTTRPILEMLGLEKTLVGVDVVRNRRLLAQDANEDKLLQILEKHPGRIIVTPIGGQGFLFGRGNLQISPAIIRTVGVGGILVVSSPAKIHELHGRPLLVDSGEVETDRLLSGYVHVITGYRERAMYRVTSSP